LFNELQNAKDENGEEKWNYDKRKNKETGELTGLFFSHLRSGSMFMRYPEVIHIDATYKVNRFNMPLLSIVGTTGINTTFQIASIFLVGKHQNDYIWAMKCLRRMANEFGILVNVIFIDDEPALALAIAQVFLEACQFYCIFHINQAVLAKIRKEYQEKDEEYHESFLNDWQAVVRAKTEQVFEEKWKDLMKDSTRKKLKKYLRELGFR
jgi:hypothetical protein